MNIMQLLILIIIAPFLGLVTVIAFAAVKVLFEIITDWIFNKINSFITWVGGRHG